MDSTVKHRVIQFIEYKNISVREFERRCGLSYGYVNNMRVSIQPDRLKNIATCFPELNTGWLMTGDGAGINKVITTHVARHTYATYLINNGISIMTVSKALGHSNTKMSERYAKLLANTVIDELATLKTK